MPKKAVKPTKLEEEIVNTNNEEEENAPLSFAVKDASQTAEDFSEKSFNTTFFPWLPEGLPKPPQSPEPPVLSWVDEHLPDEQDREVAIQLKGKYGSLDNVIAQIDRLKAENSKYKLREKRFNSKDLLKRRNLQKMPRESLYILIMALQNELAIHQSVFSMCNLASNPLIKQHMAKITDQFSQKNLNILLKVGAINEEEKSLGIDENQVISMVSTPSPTESEAESETSSNSRNNGKGAYTSADIDSIVRENDRLKEAMDGLKSDLIYLRKINEEPIIQGRLSNPSNRVAMSPRRKGSSIRFNGLSKNSERSTSPRSRSPRPTSPLREAISTARISHSRPNTRMSHNTPSANTPNRRSNSISVSKAMSKMNLNVDTSLASNLKDTTSNNDTTSQDKVHLCIFSNKNDKYLLDRFYELRQSNDKLNNIVKSQENTIQMQMEREHHHISQRHNLLIQNQQLAGLVLNTLKESVPVAYDVLVNRVNNELFDPYSNPLASLIDAGLNRVEPPTTLGKSTIVCKSNNDESNKKSEVTVEENADSSQVQQVQNEEVSQDTAPWWVKCGLISKRIWTSVKENCEGLDETLRSVANETAELLHSQANPEPQVEGEDITTIARLLAEPISPVLQQQQDALPSLSGVPFAMSRSTGSLMYDQSFAHSYTDMETGDELTMSKLVRPNNNNEQVPSLKLQQQQGIVFRRPVSSMITRQQLTSSPMNNGANTARLRPRPPRMSSPLPSPRRSSPNKNRRRPQALMTMRLGKPEIKNSEFASLPEYPLEISKDYLRLFANFANDLSQLFSKYAMRTQLPAAHTATFDVIAQRNKSMNQGTLIAMFKEHSLTPVVVSATQIISILNNKLAESAIASDPDSPGTPSKQQHAVTPASQSLRDLSFSNFLRFLVRLCEAFPGNLCALKQLQEANMPIPARMAKLKAIFETISTGKRGQVSLQVLVTRLLSQSYQAWLSPSILHKICCAEFLGDGQQALRFDFVLGDKIEVAKTVISWEQLRDLCQAEWLAEEQRANDAKMRNGQSKRRRKLSQEFLEALKSLQTESQMTRDESSKSPEHPVPRAALKTLLQHLCSAKMM
eukprot:TRINITY_DN3504_c0_g1_i3.p1 TRINITY_DN3504_c0_g1~~TRINITY_DN3504_c0_g1_i3.p1  ORF type:complete len:1080 (-),score=286.23 TRINITY_DN3504_c0_g1_i3:51-3290(-)